MSAGIGELHRLLLAMAGRLPGELLCAARGWLAGGHGADVAEAVAFAVVAGGIVVTAAEREVLGEALPVGAEVGTAALTAYRKGDGGDGGPDPAMVRAARESGADLAVWRTWRDGRVYLVHAPGRGGREQARLAARLHDAVAGTEPVCPQVDVFGGVGELPRAQWAALTDAELIWPDAPAAPVRVAGVEPGEATAGAVEHRRLAEYLDAAPLLIPVAGRLPDLLDPARPRVVPDGWRTDGRWVWPVAVVHYLMEYDRAPEPALLQHIRARDYTPPSPDLAAMHQSMTAWRTERSA